MQRSKASNCGARWGWCLVVVFSAVAGCGGGSAKTIPVTGKVTYSDGSPVKGGDVSFTGVGGKAYSTGGLILEDGSYQLSTFDDNDGAPPGEYAIGVIVDGKELQVIDPAKTVKVEAGKGKIDIKVQKAN